MKEAYIQTERSLIRRLENVELNVYLHLFQNTFRNLDNLEEDITISKLKGFSFFKRQAIEPCGLSVKCIIRVGKEDTYSDLFRLLICIDHRIKRRLKGIPAFAPIITSELINHLGGRSFIDTANTYLKMFDPKFKIDL